MKEEEEGSPQKIHLWNETKSKWGKCFKKCEKTEKALYDVWKRWKMHYTYDRWRPLDTRYSKGRHQYTWRDELMAFGESMWPHMTQDSNAQSLAAPMLWPSSCSGQNEAVIDHSDTFCSKIWSYLMSSCSSENAEFGFREKCVQTIASTFTKVWTWAWLPHFFGLQLWGHLWAAVQLLLCTGPNVDAAKGQSGAALAKPPGTLT